MKTLTEFLKNNESYEINEAIDGSSIALIITQIASLTGIIFGLITMNNATSNERGEESFIDIIKGWFKDRKAKGIAKKLAQDSDIQAFLQQPISKQRSGWRKLLQSKLDEKDFEYITRITKNSVKDKIK